MIKQRIANLLGGGLVAAALYQLPQRIHLFLPYFGKLQRLRYQRLHLYMSTGKLS